MHKLIVAVTFATLGITFITPRFHQMNTFGGNTNLVQHSAGIVTAWFAEVSGKQVEIKLG